MIPAENAHLNTIAITNPGMTGKNNEDRFGVSAFYTAQDRKTPAVLAVVADGIGGHRAGEIAAEIAVETISQVVADSDATTPVQTLQHAIVQADQGISEQADQEHALQGMGSTCACAWVIGSRLYIASVGDSRIYLIRAEKIKQLTTDHTWVQEAIEHGAIQPEQARKHPNAHVIRRYLGSKQEVVPDLRMRLSQAESDRQAESNQGLRMQPGDIILLCSDGLTDLVEDEEILAAVGPQANQDALDYLVDLANQRGGHDNITIVALTVPVGKRAEREAPPKAKPERRSRFSLTIIGIAAVLGVVAVLVGGYYWFFQRQGEPTDTPPVEQTHITVSIPGLGVTSTPADLADETNIPGALSTPEASSTPTFAEFPTSIPATLTPWPTNTRVP